MTGAAATTLWARAFVDELARAGVSDVIVAPGSRSTPLVMAFAADGRFRMRVHLDERSGAFFALGMGKASGRPAAMVTTSGTATANVFPAVIEASPTSPSRFRRQPGDRSGGPLWLLSPGVLRARAPIDRGRRASPSPLGRVACRRCCHATSGWPRAREFPVRQATRARGHWPRRDG